MLADFPFFFFRWDASTAPVAARALAVQPGPLPVTSIGEFSVTFTKWSDGTPIDPTDVTFYAEDPTGVKTPYTWSGGQVVRDGVGVFHFDLLLAVSGFWVTKWQATGVVEEATPDVQFNVLSSVFP